MRLFCLILAASFFGLYSVLALAEMEQPSPQLEAWIKDQMHRYRIPGASIAVVKNFRVEWSKGFGYSNKKTHEPVTTDTVFQAASISKPITAVEALKTFAQKGLSLDANVNSFLIHWKIPDDSYTVAQPVTMRLLLSHTAGITGFRYKGYSLEHKLPTLLEELNGIPPANTPAVTVIRQPGTKFEYSPAGYTIIQQVLVDLYQMPFAKIMRQLILQPLGMDHSTFASPPSEKYLTKIARPYLPNGEPLPKGPFIFTASAAGGLWTTPLDLAKFLIAIQKVLAGESIAGITPRIIRSMMTPGLDHNMGLGFEVNINRYGEKTARNGNYFRHIGFNSGYLSIMVGSKNQGNGIVVMVNSAPANMSKTKVTQYDFLAHVVKHISKVEKW